MKALVYNGPRNVSVADVPDPRIEQPTDAIVQITTTNICGSDLHMYEGRTDMETGPGARAREPRRGGRGRHAVERFKVGDMVCLPFNIACGFCANCERGLTAFCLTANPRHGRAPPTASPTWGPTTAGRPSTCACPTPTSTVCGCPRTRGRSRTTT